MARELAGSAEVAHVPLLSGPRERRERLAGAFGPKVELARTRTPDLVVLCLPDHLQAATARTYLDEGVSVVATASDRATVLELLDLDPVATAAGRAVVVGAAFSPGLTTVLAAHAAGLFEEVLEVHTGSVGAAGPACVEARRAAMRDDGQEWRDGSWESVRAGSAAELLWFPDPIGSVECRRGDLADPVLLRRSLPGAVRLSARSVAPARSWAERWADRLGRPDRSLDAPGAVRVEVRGRHDGRTDQVVYAAMDRPAVATAAVAAVSAVEVLRRGRTGAMGVAELGAPRDLLAELARRGVRCCTFEGTET